MTEPADRPTLQQLAAGDSNTGVACPACGCRHLVAVSTVRYGNKNYRYRSCRNCGKRVKTREEIIGEVEQRGTFTPPVDEPADSADSVSVFKMA